jgi:hypothetical protein
MPVLGVQDIGRYGTAPTVRMPAARPYHSRPHIIILKRCTGEPASWLSRAIRRGGYPASPLAPVVCFLSSGLILIFFIVTLLPVRVAFRLTQQVITFSHD